MDIINYSGSESEVHANDAVINPEHQSKEEGPMHVATVVRSFSENGGLELYAHRVIEGLLERGHRVTVICEVSDSTLKHPSLVKLFFPPAPAGIPKAKRIEHHFQAASKFVAQSGPFDVIHSQHLPMTGADAVTFHNHTANRLEQVGQDWERFLSRAKMSYSKAYRLRYQQDRILCESPVLLFPAKVCRDDFVKTYNLDSRSSPPFYVVAHPGANFPKSINEVAKSENSGPESGVKPQTKPDALNKPFTFLFVGKGFRKKGLDILLGACQILLKDGVQFRLIIAGLKGKPLDKLRLKVMGLDKSVEYLGFRKDMQNVYAQAQASVLPSRIEPFGMAPVQGMMHGLVPIVSAVSGVAEVLTDEKDSLILQNHLSAQELAGLMKRLVVDSDKLAEMSAVACATAAGLTWDQTVTETIKAYRIVLRNRKYLQTTGETD